MSTRKQQGCGMRMRRLLILSVAFLMLLINKQCDASRAVWSSWAGYTKLYPRVLKACHDKLEEWSNDPTVGQDSSSLSSSDVNGSSSPYFMRGKWKPVSGDSSPVVHPSFVSGDHGKFRFSSDRMNLLVDGKEGPRIRNISGSLYFWTEQDPRSPAFVDVASVYNIYLGEVCFVGCVRQPYHQLHSPPGTTPGGTPNGTNLTAAGSDFTPFIDDSDVACSIRGLLTLSPEKKGQRKIVSGTLESLRFPNQPGYFSSMSLDGKIVSVRNQQSLFRSILFTSATIFAVEAVIVVWQIFHSIRSPSSYFVSMLMIMVQIVAIFFLSFNFISSPLRLLSFPRFKYLLSGVTVVPLLALTFVVFLNVVFILVILRKRLVAKRLNVVERPQEVFLAVICMVIYAITGVGVWSTHNLETYVQVVWCWFLLPQVIANVFWDLRLEPLHWLYVVGVSLCRITYIGLNAMRPRIYGFDDFDDFPHGWFWGITGTVTFFGSYALLQQHYGGRAFLPQRWFGYKQVPTSKGEANQEKTFGRDTDTTLDL